MKPSRADFDAYVDRLVAEKNAANLRPVVEKELIHYEILRALDENGYLSAVTFQGGTCLRLCYGAQRYSEDLDFCAGDAFDSIDFPLLANTLKKALEGRFDVAVSLKNPREAREFGGVGVKRWTVVVNTAPARPDLPSQRIKLEVASVPHMTRHLLPLRVNYEALPSSYGFILVGCQTLEEIYADKIVSFANTVGHVRHRDAWDLPWIASRPGFDMGAVAQMVAAKHGDYRCSMGLRELLAQGCERAAAVRLDAGFVQEMLRFLPLDLYNATMGRPEYLHHMARTLADSYRSIAAVLGVA